MNFFRSPFLYFSGLLLSGIAMGDWLKFSQQGFWILLIVLLAVLLLATLMKGTHTKWLFFLSFFLLGTASITYVREETVLTGNEVQGIGVGEVEEVRKRDAEWKQVILRVDQLGEVFGKDRVLLTTRERFEVGDVLFLRMDLARIENKNNPGEFDARSYWRGKNIHYAGFLLQGDYELIEPGSTSGWKAFFRNVRRSSEFFLRKQLPEQAYGLSVAILLGNKGYLSPEVLKGFQSSGAMHVLAVSGLHVGIVMLLLSQFFQRLSRFITRERAVVLTILITFFYAGLTGFSASVMRAAIMFSIVMLGQLLSRNTNSLNTLGFSAFVLMLHDPLVVYDMGFQLSYLAMIGILTLYKPISRLFYIKNKWLLRVWQGTAVGIAAQITTLPLTLYYFNQFANYFWLSNIAVMAFSGLILGIGLSVLLLGRITVFAKFGGLILGILITVFISVIEAVAELPFSVAYGFQLSAGMVVMLYILIGIVLLYPRVYRSLAALSVIVLVPLFMIQFSRYLNLSRNEVVVYNAPHPCVSVRTGSQLYFFHDPKMKHKQVERMAQDYARLHPSRMHFIALKRGMKNRIKAIDFEIFHDSWFGFRIGNKDHQILRYISEMPDKGYPIYQSYLAAESGYSLSKGALRISI